MGCQAGPEQRHARHPLCTGQGFDGSKLNETERAGRPGRVPEFVEAHLAAVGVASNVRLEVPQRFVDKLSMVAFRK